jgi:hypothetical protein
VAPLSTSAAWVWLDCRGSCLFTLVKSLQNDLQVHQSYQVVLVCSDLSVRGQSAGCLCGVPVRPKLRRLCPRYQLPLISCILMRRTLAGCHGVNEAVRCRESSRKLGCCYLAAALIGVRGEIVVWCCMGFNACSWLVSCGQWMRIALAFYAI